LEKAWKFAKVQANIATAITSALNPTVVKSWIAMMDAYYFDPLSSSVVLSGKLVVYLTEL